MISSVMVQKPLYVRDMSDLVHSVISLEKLLMLSLHMLIQQVMLITLYLVKSQISNVPSDMLLLTEHYSPSVEELNLPLLTTKIFFLQQLVVVLMINSSELHTLQREQLLSVE